MMSVSELSPQSPLTPAANSPVVLYSYPRTAESDNDLEPEATHEFCCDYLYRYWRSSCSWRVRLALHFKGIPFEYRAINLVANEQHSEDYEQLNAGHVVPTLVIDNRVLSQSVAILEYLEERRPESWRLLPMDIFKRAQVRALVQMIASDIQPKQNLNVLQYIGEEPKRSQWALHWITKGLEAVEKVLEKTAKKYCVGDEVTLADLCLVPQVYNARRFQVDMSKFPVICRVDAELAQLPAFLLAHPDQQPDAPKATLA